MVKWQDYIQTDSSILSGKPAIKGTRISVEFILERLAHGWSEDQLLVNYPRLSKEAITAVYSYAYECMKDGLLFPQNMKRA